MSGFNMTEMSEMTIEELERTEGGVGPLILVVGGLLGMGGMVVGMEIGKSLGGGGGEVLPGFTQFHMGISAVSAANPPRPH